MTEIRTTTMLKNKLRGLSILVLALNIGAVNAEPTARYVLSSTQTHNKFSRGIKPALRVLPGAIIEIETRESSDQQIGLNSTTADLGSLDVDRVHPLTGPVYVEGAEPGDTLVVKIHEVKHLGWGWTAIFPGFGVLSEEFAEPYLRTFALPSQGPLKFDDHTNIPLNVFPGILGVAPATDEMLNTMPPRENGGNIDDPHIRAGTTVYFPVFVEGALFSVGDGHAVQGMGEVGGPALEVPLRMVYEIDLIKNGRQIDEPEYETADVYAVTAVGSTLDEAARKAVRFMVDYLERVHGYSRQDAYVLCTLAGDLKISAIVNKPNVSISMHMSKRILGM